MMRMSEAAAMLNVPFTGADAEVLRVSTDSRNTQPGDLFIALRGAKFDGGLYAAQALQQGAVGVVLDADQAPDVLHALRVPDTRLALGQLAAGWRNRFTIPIVAITGSNGKTTVKEMLAAILRVAVGEGASAEPKSRPYPNPLQSGLAQPQPPLPRGEGGVRAKGEGANAEPTPNRPHPNPPPEGEGANAKPKAIDAVLATEGNFNNDIGLPLMLLRLRDTHRYAVLEMGMNHLGEIDYLTRLARPDVALINNAQAAHVGMLGSVTEIARAKCEIYNGLDAQGIAIVNADDAHVGMWREANVGRRIVSFGLDQDANVRGEYQSDDQGSTLRVLTVSERFEVRLQVPGTHNVRNALAACTAALALNIAPNHICAGLAGFTGVKGRLQKKPGRHGSTFIDDSYNANPDSVLAALKVLSLHAGPKILVLGDMGELGEQAVALHAQIGLAARQAGIDRLFALGDLTRETVNAFGPGATHFDRIETLLADLEKALSANSTVLVKGSRFMHMERVVQNFTEAR